MPNGRRAEPAPAARPVVVLLSTPAFNELATKLRQLDRFDTLDVAQDTLQLGDVRIGHLAPKQQTPPRPR